MKNEKDNTKKSMTIRIDPKIFTQYNEQLTAIYGKKHRKKSPIIELLLEQFNNQDTEKLKQYLYQEKAIINLNLETIKEYQAQIQEKDNAIQSLEQTIQDTKQHNQAIQESIEQRYNKELELTTKQIQAKEQTIQEKDDIIQEYKKAIQDKDKEIQRLTDELNQSHKDTRAARNDYKHSTENLNKLQQEYNDVQNENKDYAVAFAEVKKMSIIEKILSRYPKKFLELSDNLDE